MAEGIEHADPRQRPVGDHQIVDQVALNTGMFELYGDAAKIFKQNILAQHPVILGLFSGAGGRFILYRPGMAPLDAPPVPIAYQLLKSVGHSTMALTEVVGPYSTIPPISPGAARCWPTAAACSPRSTASMRRRCRPDWRDTIRTILQNNIAFMDESLAKGASPSPRWRSSPRSSRPLKKIVAWAAQTQVAHWMGVLGGLEAMLGADWEKTYAASNTIYVARQNNVLFSVLAQFFGPEAINHRLILIETISFTTTPDDMLDSLTRIIADRSVGHAVLRQLPPDGLRADGRQRARRHHRREPPSAE